MDKKKTLMLIIVVIIIIALGIGLFIINKNNKNNQPTNSLNGVSVVDTNEVVKDQTIENLQITDVSFVVIDGETSFYALVTNTGPDPVDINNLYVNFIGDNFDNQLPGLTDTVIKSGGSKEIRIMIDSDLSATKSVKYLLENSD